jgi:hypothetical protein
MKASSMSLATKYGYLWVTLAFLVLSVIGHWLFAWYAYVDEQREHGQAVAVAGYLVETARDTFENWQSEFLQLLWQVGGLAVLLSIGSPQSREGDDRKEEKIDRILEKIDPKGKEIIAKLDAKYPRK